jgi:hypothetical protein
MVELDTDTRDSSSRTSSGAQPREVDGVRHYRVYGSEIGAAAQFVVRRVV